MSRTLSAPFLAALALKELRPVLLFQGLFKGQWVNLWNGIGDIVWNSVTYSGNGWLHNSSGCLETEDMVTNGMDITLAGVPPSVISLVLTSANQGADGFLHLGLLDTSNAIVGICTLYRGKYDLTELNESVDAPTVSISYENHYIDLERPREFRYNHESQKAWYPSDRGFEFVGKLADQHIFWGTVKKTKQKSARNKVTSKVGSRRRSSAK